MPRLMPSDQRFFDLFREQADLAAQAARLLHDLFRDPTRLAERAETIHQVEHDADAVTRELVLRLNSTFVTPFDAEAILRLGTHLDDVVDRIHDAAWGASEFRIEAVPGEAERLSALLQDATEELLHAVSGMKHARTLLMSIRRVKELEDAGDAVHDAAIARLFQPPSEPLEVIKWKALLDTVEAALDRCDDVADILSAISWSMALPPP